LANPANAAGPKGCNKCNSTAPRLHVELP
jgi:hypothetical protein